MALPILCDACGKRAYVHVTLDVDNLPLSFCSHHYDANAEALAAYVIRTDDLRPDMLQGAG